MNAFVRLFLLAAFVAALSYYPMSARRSNICVKSIKNASPVYNYVVLSGSRATNFAKAHEVCKSILGSLADVTFSNIVLLSNAVGNASPAWIRSWNGDDYHNACIALYSNGAIAIPPGTCKDRHSFICQVPKKVNICTQKDCQVDEQQDLEDRDWQVYQSSSRQYRNSEEEDAEEMLPIQDSKKERKEEKKYKHVYKDDSKEHHGEGDKAREIKFSTSFEAAFEDRITDDIIEIIDHSGLTSQMTKVINDAIGNKIREAVRDKDKRPKAN